MSAVAKLLALRQQVAGFRGESFPAISGAGEHGAIIHYRVTEESNRPIRPNEVYLIDSGAQFPDGTTDITRTVWTGPGEPPAAIRQQVTRVMKGHIAMSAARTSMPLPGARYGRSGWITTMAPATAWVATCPSMKGRSACRAWPGRWRSHRG
jgi:Xaa-Pro aminopeptidase